MLVTREQDDSLLATLERAGITAGGEREVVLVTGSVPSAGKPSHLAYCSSVVHVVETFERFNQFVAD